MMGLEFSNILEPVCYHSTPGQFYENIRYDHTTTATSSNPNPNPNLNSNMNLNSKIGSPDTAPDLNQISYSFFEKKLCFQPSLVSSSTPEYLGNLHIGNLLLNRKLVLIVDLDKTIIHSKWYMEPKTSNDTFCFKILKRYFEVKCRPYLAQFINNISQFYELHIFTFGARSYANEVIKNLDPEKKYFQNRIQSREDSLCKKHKLYNLKHMFPAGDNMVCIIDDNENVWQSLPNLIRVKRYTYFNKVTSLNTDDKREDPPDIIQEKPDDYLLRLENVLMEMHHSFYKHYDTNPELFHSGHLHLKTIISQRKRRVLNGCKVLFANLAMSRDIKSSWAYRLAVSYGATVQTSMVIRGQDITTHVIGMKQFLKYANNIKGTSVSFVNMDWLIESIENWEKADETLYPISKESSQRYREYRDFKGCCDEAD